MGKAQPMVGVCLRPTEALPEVGQAQATALDVCLPTQVAQTPLLTLEVANLQLMAAWATLMELRTLHILQPRTTTRLQTAFSLEDPTKASSPLPTKNDK